MKARSIIASCIMSSVACCVLILSPSPLAAQHGRAAPDTRAPREASQFAFLIGQWELEVKPKATTLAARIHGAPKLQGTWKAWRAFDGWGIEDELRIVDASGNPQALTHSSRVFDPATRRWNVSSLDVFRAAFKLSNSVWADNAMVSTSQSADEEGKPVMVRVTLSKITPTSFRYQQDRSDDGGKSWTDGVLVIDAKRTAASAPR
jgi:hypothetical protein